MDEMVTLYQIFGEEAGVRALVKRFYELMDTEHIAKGIRALHPQNLSESEEKTALFLIGWFGGPQRYIEKYGHPRLRARHLPFPIDSKARDAWMHCMRIAIRERIPQPEVHSQIEQAFWQMANHMRNTPDVD